MNLLSNIDTDIDQLLHTTSHTNSTATNGKVEFEFIFDFPMMVFFS
jgi:hypothetical protein